MGQIVKIYLGHYTSGGAARVAGRRKVARESKVRRAAGSVYRIEITGLPDGSAMDALELEIRDLARRYGAELEDFSVEGRRRSG